MIYQNKAWRDETGFDLDPTGKVLEPISEDEEPLPDKEAQEDDEEFEEHECQVFRDVGIDKKVKKRSLRKGEVIRFSAMDDFTGDEMKLVGEVIGDHEAVKKQFPEECAEAEEGFYLVKVGNRSGLFVVSMDEVLEVLGKKEEK